MLKFSLDTSSLLFWKQNKLRNKVNKLTILSNKKRYDVQEKDENTNILIMQSKKSLTFVKSSYFSKTRTVHVVSAVSELSNNVLLI